MALTLSGNGSLVGVSSHESDEIVENAVIVNPTSSASPSYEATRESEPSRISSVDTCACGYDENPTYESANRVQYDPRAHTNTCVELVNEP